MLVLDTPANPKGGIVKKLEELSDFGPLPSAAQLAYHLIEMNWRFLSILTSMLFMSRSGGMVKKIPSVLIRLNWMQISGSGF